MPLIPPPGPPPPLADIIYDRTRNSAKDIPWQRVLDRDSICERCQELSFECYHRLNPKRASSACLQCNYAGLKCRINGLTPTERMRTPNAQSGTQLARDEDQQNGHNRRERRLKAKRKRSASDLDDDSEDETISRFRRGDDEYLPPTGRRGRPSGRPRGRPPLRGRPSAGCQATRAVHAPTLSASSSSRKENCDSQHLERVLKKHRDLVAETNDLVNKLEGFSKVEFRVADERGKHWVDGPLSVHIIGGLWSKVSRDPPTASIFPPTELPIAAAVELCGVCTSGSLSCCRKFLVGEPHNSPTQLLTLGGASSCDGRRKHQ
ncbi:hypothetical protein CONPUDRAFT_70323 [Coniophora puteana RWD-64-598 SS2]|uniref:Uncharacterized protein n=1 Tax=Coniophora puteana (strain RWD-64-598) TaxID=741705 RepID=A0A5M3N2D2_CONPW|nr:uncharacterized protein CONPUDRAFT_70323 [Coniophora puteana RWD-64-598 SS2]EIW85542.1 hypothetical protein CONPUDRAFT_70323 [Coniophora puteana RWD-64-598 SS2]